MKHWKTMKQIQTELFCEVRLKSDQIVRDLPPDQQANLRNGIMELLLKVALGDEEVRKGADYDA
jgi:hypothetical protein